MLGRNAALIGALIVAGATLAGCTAAPAAAAKPPRIVTPTPSPTAACIEGTWTAGAKELQPIYDAIPANLDYPAATLDPAASVSIDFAGDGAFSLHQAVPTTLTWEGHPAAVALGGTMTGTYTATGSALTLSATDDALTVTPTDDSTASALFAAATQVTLNEWPVSATSFRCDADALALDLVTEGHAATVDFARG